MRLALVKWRQMQKTAGAGRTRCFSLLSPQSELGVSVCAGVRSAAPRRRAARPQDRCRKPLVEVEAAAGPGTVQGLAHKVQPRTAPERKALWLQLRPEPAAGGLAPASSRRGSPPQTASAGPGLPGGLDGAGSLSGRRACCQRNGPAWVQKPQPTVVHPLAGRQHGLRFAGPNPRLLMEGNRSDCGMLRPPLGSQHSDSSDHRRRRRGVVRKLQIRPPPTGRSRPAGWRRLWLGCRRSFAGVGGLQGGQAGVYGISTAGQNAPRNPSAPTWARGRPLRSITASRVQGGALLGVQLGTA